MKQHNGIIGLRVFMEVQHKIIPSMRYNTVAFKELQQAVFRIMLPLQDTVQSMNLI